MLGSSDLATFGSSAFIGLGAILRTVAPAQFACNVAGLWVRELRLGAERGRQQRRLAAVRADHRRSAQMLPASSRPRPTCTINYYPIEDSSQCQAGNEGYSRSSS